MTTAEVRRSAIFGEEMIKDAMRLTMLLYVGMIQDEKRAGEVATWDKDQIVEDLGALAERFVDKAKITGNQVNNVKRWHFGCEQSIQDLSEELKALGNPPFPTVQRTSRNWYAIRMATGTFPDISLELACISVEHGLKGLQHVFKETEAMMRELRMKNSQAIMVNWNSNQPVQFEDWEMVAMLVAPTFRYVPDDSRVAEVTNYLTLCYEVKGFQERKCAHSMELVRSIHAARGGNDEERAEILSVASGKLHEKISLLLDIQKWADSRWNFACSLQLQWDRLVDNEHLVNTTLTRAIDIFQLWQGTMKTITTRVLKDATLEFGKKLIAFRLALVKLQGRHKQIRGEIIRLCRERGELLECIDLEVLTTMNQGEANAALRALGTKTQEDWKPEQIIKDPVLLRNMYQRHKEIYQTLFPDTEYEDVAQDATV